MTGPRPGFSLRTYVLRSLLWPHGTYGVPCLSRCRACLSSRAAAPSHGSSSGAVARLCMAATGSGPPLTKAGATATGLFYFSATDERYDRPPCRLEAYGPDPNRARSLDRPLCPTLHGICGRTGADRGRTSHWDQVQTAGEEVAPLAYRPLKVELPLEIQMNYTVVRLCAS